MDGVVGRVVGAAVLLGVLAAGPGHAADRPIAGKKLLLKDGGSAARIRLVAKDAGIAVPSAGGPDDPRIVGATLEVLSPMTGELGVIDMPAAGWLANTRGTVFRFKGKRAPGGTADVKVAVVKGQKQIKLKGTSTGITSTSPSRGASP